MAQTKAQLIADWRQHIGQPESSNSTVTDAQGLIWLNQGYGIICEKLRHLPRKERDYSLSSYSASTGLAINAETITIDEVLLKNPDSLNSDGTAKYQAVQVISFAELVAMDPDYQAVTADMPTLAARKSTSYMVLYPTPKASVKAQTTPLRTYGFERPTDLSSDSDVPDIPGNLHYLIPHWMAYRTYAQQENQVKVSEHLTIFNSGIKANMQLATEFSRQTKHWKVSAE